jgi:hypothetical protein
MSKHYRYLQKANDGSPRQTKCTLVSAAPPLLHLFKILSQSDGVKGKVSLTCDTWQASNSDGHFAVRGSWIEEDGGKWKLPTALLGFTQLNNAHNGMRLGQALFKIVCRAKIAHKVSVTYSLF